MALHQLYDKFPNAKLLISTIGPKNDEVYNELFIDSILIKNIGLQFSIHESTDEKRNKLIPLPGKLSLKEISELGYDWAVTTNRRPFINYCVHDKNNTDDDAERLYDLFGPGIWNVTLSVICERDEHVAAANARQKQLVEEFKEKLLCKGSYNIRIFDPAGQDDIGGGCGQLWFVQEWMRNNPDKAKKSVGYNLPILHTPRE